MRYLLNKWIQNIVFLSIVPYPIFANKHDGTYVFTNIERSSYNYCCINHISKIRFLNDSMFSRCDIAIFKSPPIVSEKFKHMCGALKSELE